MCDCIAILQLYSQKTMNTIVIVGCLVDIHESTSMKNTHEWYEMNNAINAILNVATNVNLPMNGANIRH